MCKALVCPTLAGGGDTHTIEEECRPSPMSPMSKLGGVSVALHTRVMSVGNLRSLTHMS